MSIINEQAPETSNILEYIKDGILQENSEGKYEQVPMEEVWRMLYNDCLSALEICVEGDLKHFHKARFMLAQGLYKRGGIGDLQRAKDELSFCFKSSRSSFTINMWEIDGMVKKGRFDYNPTYNLFYLGLQFTECHKYFRNFGYCMVINLLKSSYL